MRFLVAAVVGALVASVAIVPTEPVTAGGVDRTMCFNHDDERAAVDSDFYLNVCLKNNSLFVSNTGSSVVYLLPSGEWTNIARAPNNTSASTLLVEAVIPGDTFLPPGFLAVITLTGGAFELELDYAEELSEEYNSIKGLESLTGWVPTGGVGAYQAASAFFYEIRTVTTEYLQCLDRNGWIGQVGCSLEMKWDVDFALARLVLAVGGGPGIGLIIGLVETGRWVADLEPDADRVRNGSRGLEVLAVQQSEPPTPTPTPTTSLTVPTPEEPAPATGTVTASGRRGTCGAKPDCLIADLTISGFSPHPSTYTCVFSDGTRADFQFSVQTVSPACFTPDRGDWIEILVNGVRSNRITSQAFPTEPTLDSAVTTTTTTTTTTTQVQVPRTATANGRRGSCSFSSDCLVADLSISGFSPHPGTYTCVFSDGFRQDFSFSGGSVSPACFSADAGDWIEIVVDGVRTKRITSQAFPPTPKVTTTTTPASRRTYSAHQGSQGADTFGNPTNASNPGPRIPPDRIVDVFCTLKPAQSIGSETHWYLVATSPWTDFYAPASTFWNGGPVGGGRSTWVDVDPLIPAC